MLFENGGTNFHFLQSSRSPSTTWSSSSPDADLLMRLYKQMILEMNKPASTAVPECRSSTRPGSMPVKENKSQKSFQPVHLVQKERDNGGSKTVLSSDEKPLEGSYIVGRSVSGWNFITFGGTDPVY